MKANNDATQTPDLADYRTLSKTTARILLISALFLKMQTDFVGLDISRIFAKSTLRN
jgi:hypothetical protein